MKKHIRLSILTATVLAICLLAALPSVAQNPYSRWKFDPISFNPPKPERFVLDNGLVVYFLPNHQLPVVTMSALVRAGEVYVPADKAGLAGIAGDGLVTGGTATKPPDEIDEQIESLGIQWSGDIGLESGQFSMNCLSKDLGTALPLFAELLMKPRFDSSRVQLAVANALEDLRRQNDSPGRIVRREFSKLVYGDHPYGRSPSEKSLGSLTRGDAVGFHERFFHPNTIILAVSGDLDVAALKSTLQTLFGSWKKADVSYPEVATPGTNASPGVYQINKDLNQTNIRFGHLGIDRHNPDRHAVRVLNYILGGGGFTSRMIAKVRSDSGWAYSVGTAFTGADKGGLFLATCQTKTETTAKALALMEWVVEDVRAHGIREEELETAKDAILNSDVFNYDEPDKIVENYAWEEYQGFPPDQLQKDVEAIKAVTKADVDAAAAKYLHPDQYTILAVGKIDAFDSLLSKFGNVKTMTLPETP
jgi:predicted Zn-dependent peptidase